MMKKLFSGCLTIIGAIVVIGIIIAVATGGDDSTTTSTEGTSNDQPKEKTKEEQTETIGIGETATIDDIGFTVTNAESKTTIEGSDEYTEPVTTDNQFIVLDVTINNGKSEAITTDSEFFTLVSNDGTEYSPKNDGDLMMVIPTDKMLFFEEINPGLKKEGMIVFEVGSDVQMSDLTLKADAGFWGTKSVNINLN
ncbi:DUF4352 domain-containing protein [Pontibacillus chungwhensis]|nr:DUF4352 domain-containing protein [Pontibacillus chungwhensis]